MYQGNGSSQRATTSTISWEPLAWATSPGSSGTRASHWSLSGIPSIFIIYLGIFRCVCISLVRPVTHYVCHVFVRVLLASVCLSAHLLNLYKGYKKNTKGAKGTRRIQRVQEGYKEYKNSTKGTRRIQRVQQGYKGYKKGKKGTRNIQRIEKGYKKETKGT